MPLLKNRTPLVVAQLINNAGIVGAALAASEAGEDESEPPRPRRPWCSTDASRVSGADVSRRDQLGCVGRLR